MKNRVRAALAATGVVALLATGCSDLDPATEDKADPSKVQAGQETQEKRTEDKQDKEDTKPAAEVKLVAVGNAYDGGYMHPVAVVDNPSGERVSVNVDFAAYDKDGNVLSQYSETLEIGARQKGAVTTQLGDGSTPKPAKVEAEVDVESSGEDKYADGKLEPITVKYKQGEYDDTVTAKIRNTYKKNLRNYTVTAACYRGEKLVGGGVTIVDSLHRAGTERPVEISLISIDGKADRCELYPEITEFFTQVT